MLLNLATLFLLNERLVVLLVDDSSLADEYHSLHGKIFIFCYWLDDLDTCLRGDWSMRHSLTLGRPDIAAHHEQTIH